MNSHDGYIIEINGTYIITHHDIIYIYSNLNIRDINTYMILKIWAG